MTNGFNASVPSRKPKTRIGRVLMELTSDPEAPAVDLIDDDAHPGSESDDDAQAADGAMRRSSGEHVDPVPSHAAGRSPTNRAAYDVADRVAAPAAETAARPLPHSTEPSFSPREEAARTASRTPSLDAAAVQPASLGLSTTSTERHRDRLAALRERLALAAQPRPVASEPKHTAAAVQELIEELRGRVEAAATERSRVVDELEDTRAALAKAEAELERERRIRADVEARAEERRQVADDAVAEAESLAAERDLVLAELATQRRLDDEQSALIAEAEAALDRHRAEREAAVQEIADMRNLLDLRTAEIAELESRIEAEFAKRAKVEARCRELEAEIARLAEATEALDAIQGMVRSRR